MDKPRVLLDGIAFGESPRWYGDRLWFADWGAGEVVAVGGDGAAEVVLRPDFPTFPMCIAWLPGGGGLLVVSSSQDRVLLRAADGALVPYADLGAVAHGWNEITADGRGRVYVNGGGFDLMAGEEFRPGVIALVTADGGARQVADGVAFPNGMLVTPDDATLIVAESYANRLTAFDVGPDGGLSNRRVWADLGDGCPDGICMDAEGAVWYADVPNRRCVRVREGGEVLAAVELDRGCFACALGGPDGRTLYLVATEWGGVEKARGGPRTGQLLAVPAPAPGVGRP